MVVFHNIGLDRLVNSYRNPAVVNRTVQYTSCPGTMHTMDLDNITNSVVVTTGGSLTFSKMIMQVSVEQSSATAQGPAALDYMWSVTWLDQSRQESVVAVSSFFRCPKHHVCEAKSVQGLLPGAWTCSGCILWLFWRCLSVPDDMLPVFLLAGQQEPGQDGLAQQRTTAAVNLQACGLRHGDPA